ncbi:hypothetical protein E1287_08180 [Actinomadura sp. KC06]|uniref:DUF5994 family protein n=1 Tax=Actinomadura sp. KC06 TaxID=2530369 RepID=UPI0010528DEE|nr:DUF5994 family protein [Actinomadura sp. KC06]TDD37542.1 hypothetical protein E1287_08180 [Actinomadura sp. KC06]
MARDTAPLAFPPGTTTASELMTAPGPRLRLAPGRAERGVMNGGWWPRSRDTAAELTELLTALAIPPDAAARVTIDFNDWDDIPLRITVLGREVRVGWLAHLDHMVALTCARADPLLLLVIPPETTPASAEDALARCAAEIGVPQPQDILASCDIPSAIAEPLGG